MIETYRRGRGQQISDDGHLKEAELRRPAKHNGLWSGAFRKPLPACKRDRDRGEGGGGLRLRQGANKLQGGDEPGRHQKVEARLLDIGPLALDIHNAQPHRVERMGHQAGHLLCEA